ncbi:hypothetical protein BDN72DRAFT_834870 [Pluteus cervinus]|uniref:Uncharacterized protein n=1 Tax=Pluteus cervinus TaxID=181527 RepID=A0ACD3B517_9AGAR|nr:hypothetical protein BDN72DRAFT_834870 [Pluteus cervinus]
MSSVMNVLRGWRNSEPQIAQNHIDKLSAELLSLIFICCAEDSSNVKVLGDLGMVCMDWRAAVLSTPQLWTYIDARFTSATNPGHDDRVQSLIQRSGARPLHINLLLSGSLGSRRDTFKALMETSTRWQTASITLPFGALSILSTLQNQLPIIQELRMKVIEDRNSNRQPVFEILDDVPALEVLQLDWFTAYSWVAPPWSQLKRFSGSYHSLKQTLYLLNNLTHVEELEIVGWVRPCPQLHLDALPTLDLQVGSLEFPNLHTLRFRDSVKPNPDDPHYTPPIANAIRVMTAPALTHVTMPRAATEHVYHLFHRSKCDVTHLTLEGELWPAGDLITLLEATPNITFLHLGLGTLREIACLAVQEPKGGRRPVAPNLRELIINRMDSRKNPCPEILNLKEVRMLDDFEEGPPGKRLELIRVLKTKSSGQMGLYRHGGWDSWLEKYIVIVIFLAAMFPNTFYW